MASTETTTLFTGDLRPFPGIPAEWPESKRRTAESLLVALRTIKPSNAFGPDDVDPDADIENFWEDAWRMVAAWRASGRDMVLVDPAMVTWDAGRLARRMGPVTINELGGHHAIDRYITDPLLLAHGGRAMALAGLEMTDDPRFAAGERLDMATWFAERARQGVTRGIFKRTANKAGIWSIELHPDASVMADRLSDVLEWSAMHLAEVPDTFLVQDQVDLQFEMRLFVVDGRMVSAAGQVEEFTPLDRDQNSTSPFDDRLRRYRGHHSPEGKSPVTREPEVAAQLLAFGRQMAAEHGASATIDVALRVDADGTSTPVVVELNELSNSGMFASDPEAVARALATATDRGYRDDELNWLPRVMKSATPAREESRRSVLRAEVLALMESLPEIEDLEAGL